MKKKTTYNVRIVDNGDGTYTLGFISRCRSTKRLSKQGIAGEWVTGNRNKMIRLLVKGTLKD